jgi:hypothetical protein
MGTSKFPAPPPIENRVAFDAYLLELHHNVYNLKAGEVGSMDRNNGAISVDDTTNDLTEGDNLYYTADRVDALIEAGDGITKAYGDLLNLSVTAVTDPGDITATITGTAGASYTANEQTMINAAKTDLDAAFAAFNDLLAQMRTAGIIR